MIDTLTMTALTYGLLGGLAYCKWRLRPFRQLQRGSTWCRACVICSCRVARKAVINWRYCWAESVWEAREGR